MPAKATTENDKRKATSPPKTEDFELDKKETKKKQKAEKKAAAAVNIQQGGRRITETLVGGKTSITITPTLLR